MAWPLYVGPPRESRAKLQNYGDVGGHISSQAPTSIGCSGPLWVPPIYGPEIHHEMPMFAGSISEVSGKRGEGGHCRAYREVSVDGSIATDFADLRADISQPQLRHETGENTN